MSPSIAQMDEWMRLLEATFRANNALAKARKTDAAYPLTLLKEARTAAAALKDYTDRMKAQEKAEVRL